MACFVGLFSVVDSFFYIRHVTRLTSLRMIYEQAYDCIDKHIYKRVYTIYA